MQSTTLQGSIQAADLLHPLDAPALLAQAHMLQAGAQRVELGSLLRGKRLGLMCQSDQDAQAALFRAAATELGAHVSHIQPHLDERSDARQIEETARLLGQLYDAVECQGMAEALVQRLARAASVPIYPGLASDRHPCAELAPQLGGAEAMADKRRWLVQAALLNSIG